MDKDRVNSRSSRNRKLPLPNGATPKNGNERTGMDNNEESPDWTSDTAGMERFDETPTRDLASPAPQSSPEKSGVAYISETLIRRLTKEENLQLVTSLHITLGKDLNKKIKYIENLDKLKKLQHLNLNGHMIEKIEKLDPLTQLRELHLANNKISKIEGLDCLVHLQVLNLSGNLIEHLPVGPFKKLKELQVFHVAHNKLTSLVEVTRLRPLPDLTSFSMEGNAMSELQHSRQFVIFQLRTLESLDRRKISDDERKMADERFAQEEVRRLEAEITRQERDNELLRNEKLQARNEVEELKRSYSEQKLQSVEDAKRIKDLRQELEAKEELLKSKTAELSKACEKQFKLEQELAFYKLDAKFKHLGMMPLPEGVEFGDGEDDESPYIGKARFKPNNFTRESNVPSDERYSMSHPTPLGSRLVDRYDKQNQLLQQDIHDSLVLDLQEKEEAIKQAEEARAQLNNQLNRRKTQLQDAEEKLATVRQAIEDQAQLLGDEERKLIEAIADKTNYIRKLQQVAKELEDRLNKVADDITQREEEANKLRQTIRSTSPDDPVFPHLQTKLAAKEQQLKELRGEYAKLKQDYDRAQARLQEERAALKNLDAQLQSSRRAHKDQDELREELKNIIDDLNDNLNHMKQQVTQQAKQISQLQHENDALQQQKSASNKHLRDNVAKLQEQLKLNEDALDKERKNGDMLRRRISDLECQVSQGTSLEPVLAELKDRLHEAEAEVARLQNALNKAKQQLQDDRQGAVERLRKEQEKVEKALQAARNAGNKDRENKELLTRIDALTTTNASLADRLKDAEDELGNLESLLDKGEVLERLNALVGDINSNTEEVRLPLNDADDLGRALADLHHKYLDLISDLKHERRDKTSRDREADGELELVRAKLLNAESALKQARDKCSQLAEEKDERDARIKKMSAELKKLEDKLRKQERLEDELKKERKAHDLELGTLKDQVAMLSDQLKRSREDIDDELSSATEPLRAKIRDLENGMQQLQNKLSKAKADSERLKAAVSAAESGRGDLEEKIEELMDELMEAKAQAEKNGKYALQKGVLENKVKALQDELERVRERLKALRSEAADKLQAEKEKAAFRIGRLEDEIDDLKDRLRRLQNTADDELTRMKKDGARKVKDLEDKVGNLRNQVQEEREKREQELMKARRKEEALQDLLGESQARLQKTAQKSHSQEAMMQDLQQQISGLRNSLKEAETQAMKEQLDKELQAVKAEQRKAAAQAAAAKQLADAEQQVETLKSFLDAKDRQLHDQIKLGAQNASDLAAQRAEISNLASALTAQSKELSRLKEDLAQISRAHVIPTYSHIPDPSLTALANEVDALRAALVDKEHQVERLTRSLPGPPYPQLTTASQASPAVGTLMYGTPVAPATAHGHETTLLPGTTGVVTTPATLITSTQPTAPGHTVHHHHHFTKAGARGKKKVKSLTLPAASSAMSPLIAGTTTVTSGAPSSPVYHHFYDETAGQGDEHDEKKRRKKKTREEVFLCNIPEHDGLEYEVGRLEGLLSSSLQAQKSEKQRDSLRMDLKDLETEVENSLKRRAASRQNQQHSLDATLAAGGRNETMRCGDEHEAERFPRKYLQQSSTYKIEPRKSKKFSSVTFDEPDEDARWEGQLREVDRVDRILRKKKSELLEMDAVLVDRRSELDEVMHKRKMAEARLRRAEEDAGVIEQRAAETSVELIRASNQMINLELKAKELTEKRDQITKSIDAKTKELDNIQISCNELEHNFEKMNSDLKGRTEELNRKENELKDVESRLQLTLRLEELRQQVASIEREEQNQTKKYVTALKEGEQALEEKTAQLARTRNDLHSQMIKFHDVNSKITKSREELENIQLHITNGRKEIKQLSEQREEDNTIQNIKLKEAQAKLEEINKARGDCMTALKKQREEFTLLRKKSKEVTTRIKNLEESKKQKEDELEQLSSLLGDRERELDKLRTDLDKNHGELETVNADVQSEKKTLENLSTECKIIQEKHRDLLNQQQEMQKEVVLLENEVNRLKCERQAEQESADHVAGVVRKVKQLLAVTEEELSTTSTARDCTTQQLAAVERTLEERKDQLNRVNEEIKTADENLQAATNNVAIAREKHEHYIKEMEKLMKEYDETEMDSVEAKGNRFNEENKSPDEAKDDRENKKINDSIVTRLQSRVKRVMAENHEKSAALQDAKNELKELKSLITNERESNHEYFVEMASKTEMYQQQFERLQMIYEAEKLRNANEKAALLRKTEQHQLGAKRLSEELRSLRQSNLQTKQEIKELKETLANDVKILGGHIETMNSQMRSELALTLKEAEKWREHAIDELREDQGEMQVQLVAIQHTIDAAVQKKSQVTEQKRSAGPRSQRDDAVWKNERVKLQRHQTYLRAQIRQQMSTRAEILDEERKKAEGSLVGLKNKLKNLEEVISRKDASIQDFRLKLMTSKLETERTADSNKQIDQLRKRLQEVEDEKDLITHQRNYFVKLRTDANLDIDGIHKGQHSLVVHKKRATTKQLRRSLDSLIGASSSVRQWDLLQDLQGASNIHGELRSKGGVQLQTSLAAEFQDKACRNTHQSLTESSALTRSDLSRETTNNTRQSLTSRTVISSDLLPSTARSLLNYSDELSDKKRASIGKDVVVASKPSYGRKTITAQDAKRNIKEHRKGFEEMSNSTRSIWQGSRSSPASSFANKKKIEFLIAVQRLKNEKVKQLESTFKKLAFT